MTDRPTHPDYGRTGFDRDVAEHRLTILHDQGLYRHLRCQRPDTGLEHFDIITWPGHLHIGGDRDGYTFSRLDDMFEFFRPTAGWNSARINPQYWAEKITDGRERAREYSRERAEAEIWRAVRDEYRDAGKDAKGLAKAVQDELVDGWEGLLDFENTARQAITEFKFTTPTGDFEFPDAWEWKLWTWSYHYLWSCHAIQWGIAQYDQAKAATAASARACCQVWDNIMSGPGVREGSSRV